MKNSISIAFFLFYCIVHSQSISDVRYYLEPVIYETEYEVFDKMFNITIQSGRTQVNVRNTYEIDKNRQK